MKAINIILYYLVILPISLLPFTLLYLLSDALYVLFYYLLGYRKKIVLQNIRNSFPEKSVKEHNEICKKFYKHFCDLVVESIKIFSISEQEITKRFICNNPEVVNKYYKEQRSVIFVGGHYNNWEYLAVAIDALVKHKGVGIYKPLSNLYFNDKMIRTRSRYGLGLLSTKDVKHYFEKNTNLLNVYIFGIDQSPSNPTNAYWMKFLNQDTGVLFGAEKYAKEYNYPVVFGRINKIKRGHFSLDFFDITDSPNETAYGEITKKATQILEKDIQEMPEYWLWTHRRWKHKRPQDTK